LEKKVTLSLDPFEKVVSEISQRFQPNSDSEGSWQVAQGIVWDIGGSAINVGGTTLEGDQAAWGRSSMSDAWLDVYQSKKYYLIDPFLTALLAGQPEVMTDCGTLHQSNPAYELNHDLKSHGYGSLYASTCGSMSNGYRSLVVFCSDQTLAEVNEKIGFNRLKVIHAIIAANILKPNGEANSGRITVRTENLTPRENDILKWLACGLRNDQIAFKANIAEVTVRKHLLSVRRKLQATTREQAIAIAIRDEWIFL
jgi:DNA-binding CsgD family transcriptional regulator